MKESEERSGVTQGMNLSLYKHKSLWNKGCSSSKCDNQAKKIVLFSLGSSLCKQCANKSIQNNLGIKEGLTDSPPGKDRTLQSLIGENK
jgi:hypothetical protein